MKKPPTLLSILLMCSLVSFATSPGVIAQVSLTTMGSAYTEDFNTLASTSTSSTVPTGWAFSESGTNANTMYTAGTGSGTTGDTYSFGSTSSSDRAFGGLQSGTLVPTIGASFTNNTGSTITSLAIAYTGEEWRLGTRNRFDSLQFQLSTNATSLTTGTWTRYTNFDFATPDTAGTAGARDGNTLTEQSTISSTITGLNITNGASFWIRWTDFNASGADDGLSVDGFSLTPTGSSTDPSGTGVATPSSVAAGNSTLLTVAVTPGSNPTSTGLAVQGDITSIGGAATQTFFDDGTNGDVTIGDNTFSFQATVAGGTSTGAKSLPVTIADAQSRSGSTSIALTVTALTSADSIAISQIYGAGGNSGATYLNDYIELFNRSTSSVSLSGWSVQYASATGTSWTRTDLTGTIAAGGYFLIQESSGGANGATLPTPDVTGTTSMASGAGKVALVNTTTTLTGSCPTGSTIVDFVGYGATANCFEGTGPTPAPGATSAALRGSNGCTDANDNSTDFTAGTPNPRNTASPTYVCNTPVVTLSVVSIDFGNQRLGVTSTTHTVKMKNIGTAVLTIASITVSGDYSQSSSCASTLNPGDSCTIDVSFTPTALGARPGTLTVTDNAMNSPQSVSLTGVGVAPAVRVSPASLSFGNQRVATASVSQSVVLTNIGTASLIITSITIPTGSLDFSRTHNCGSTLNPGDSCTIGVTFTPSALGLRTGTLRITDDASNSPQDVSLSGTGIAPSVMLDSASLSFPDRRVGVSSTPHTVKLKNIGTDVLNLTSLSVTSGATDFSELHTCSTSVNPGDSCSIDVIFTPSTTGLRVGTLSIVDDAPGSPHPITFSGTGISPGVSLDPSSLDFGNQRLNVASTVRHITLTNSGTDVLNISSITAGGDYSQSNNCPATLNPGQNCTIDLTFTPTALGLRSATLTIIDDAPGSPHGVSLSGTGVAPSLLIVDPVVDFGSVHIGASSSPRPVKLINNGTDVLTFTSIGITFGSSDYSETHICASTLNPGDTCTMSVTFTPSTTGTRTGTITVTDDASGSPHSVSLTGNGLPPCPTITISPNTLPDGDAGVFYTQTISASGGSGVYSFSVTSGSLPNGLSLTPSGLLSGTPTVAGNSSFTITVNENTGCVGSRNYTLHINPLNISGNVFSDRNNNAAHDPSEPPLQARTIFLDANGNGAHEVSEDSTESDAIGNYSFIGLPGGPYKVRVVQQSSWTQSTSNPSDIFSTTSNVDFGLHDTLPPIIENLVGQPDSTPVNHGPYVFGADITDNDSLDHCLLVVRYKSALPYLQSVTMTERPFYDPEGKSGTGNWWAISDPLDSLIPGTVVNYHLEAYDRSGNVERLPLLEDYIFTILPKPPAEKFTRVVEQKSQFPYEGIWYDTLSNSWCGPTSASACLQWLGIPPSGSKSGMVEDLAKQMSTDNLTKASARGTGNKGNGTNDNSFVQGLNDFLTKAGKRNGVKINVYDGDGDAGSTPGVSYIHRFPTFDDYDHELHRGEDVLIGLSYLRNGKRRGGHWLVGEGQIPSNPPTIIMMDPGGGKTSYATWKDTTTNYGGGAVIDVMVTVSPISDVAPVSTTLSPNGRYSLGSVVIPSVSVHNFHPFHTADDFYVHIQVPVLGYDDSGLVSNLFPGEIRSVALSNLSLTTRGDFAINAFTAAADTNPSNDHVAGTFTVDDSTTYRTASMPDWAHATDFSGKPKPLKRKPNAVDFTFNLIVPAIPGGTSPSISLALAFSMPVEKLKIYSSKLKLDTICFTSSIDSKRKNWALTLSCDPLLVAGEELQCKCRGLQAKSPSVTYQWNNNFGAKILKGKLPGTPAKPGDVLKTAILRWPMPNLWNVAEEIFGQSPALDTGMVIGEVRKDSAKKYGWVRLKKLGDAQKSLIDKGFAHAGNPREFDAFLSGKSIVGEQKSLSPMKYQNPLFAEALALTLNVAASDKGKFPVGLGDLIIGYTSDILSANLWDCYQVQFNPSQTVRDFLGHLKQWMTRGRYWKSLPQYAPPCDSVTYRALLYRIASDINQAFAGAIDTIPPWSGGKIRLTGVHPVADVSFLHGNPVATPGIIKDEPLVLSQEPLEFKLAQNYPNPFNPLTVIRYSLSVPSFVTLKVYNVLGQEVAELIHSELMDEGEQEVEFDANTFSSGVYFYHLTAEAIPDEDGVAGETSRAVKKMVLIK